MITKTRMILATLAVAATGLAATSAQAELVEAATWNGGGDEFNYGKAVGWQFTALSDMSVTHLGVLDLGDMGLADEHTVGIFAMDGTLLGSSTIGAGLSGDLMAGSMIYNSVDLIDLEKNTSYYILADNWTQDTYTFGTGVVEYGSDIQWDQFSESTTDSILDSVLHFQGQPGNLGPGFIYRATPAPGALALLGLAGLAGRKRRRTC